jgi:hypothetical protein
MLKKTFGAVVLALVLPAAAALAANTHLGVPPANLVTLQFDQGKGIFFKVGSQGGGSSATPFVVPNNQSLVVLDVDWTFNGGVVGSVYHLTLEVKGTAGQGPVFRTQAVMGASGETVPTGGVGGGANVVTTAGFVVGPAAHIMAEFDGVLTSNITLQGYLVNNK